jgi:hypothetical protein
LLKINPFIGLSGVDRKIKVIKLLVNSITVIEYLYTQNYLPAARE